MTSNLLIKNYTHELERKQARLLSKAVSGLENSPDVFWSDREELYFLLEPFAREYKEFNDDPKYYEYSGRKKWVADALRNIHKPKKALKKYRATLFAWLSYYYPQRAAALNDSMGVAIPLYEGHPDRTDCSEEAKQLFRNQPRIKPEPPAPPPTSPEKLETSLVDDPQPLKKNPSRRRPFAVIVGVALFFASVGAFAFYYAYGSGQSIDSEEAMSSPTDGAPLTAANTDTDDLETNKPDVSEKPKNDPQDAAEPPENDNEQTGLSAEQTRQVDAVWDQIPNATWSAQPLGNFRSWVQRANRSDLFQAAQSGNRDAQTLAGIGYHLAIFGSTNHSVGLGDYLRPACDAGQGRACALVGAHYGQRNMGVSQNMTTARRFYAKSCQLGNHMGCYLEGTRLLTGFAGEQDPARGYAQLGRSCDAGACEFAMIGYSKGTLIQPNLELAKRYYLRAQRFDNRRLQISFEQWLSEQRYYWGQSSTVLPRPAQ